MSLPSAYISRPRVLISDQYDAELSNRVLTAFVEETIEGLYRCEITVDNYGVTPANRMDYIYFGRDRLDFGTDLALQLGPGNPPAQVFKGRITGLEASYPPGGGAQLTILVEDRLQALRMKRRTRSFEDISDEDVIQQIASEHSLTPDVSAQGATHRVLTQVNQSDLAFIRERARCVNAEVWLEDTTLYVKLRTERNAGSVDLAYGANLISFTVRADLAHQVTEVGVSGWDVAAKDAINETADESAISAELNGNTSGASILSDKFAVRSERVVHTVPLTTEDARDAAQARYRERARRFVTGSGIADGNAQIRVGATVNLSGLGSLFDGSYSVVRVLHTYDGAAGSVPHLTSSGLAWASRSHDRSFWLMVSGPINLERASTGPGGLFYGVYSALVVDVQDPDSQGRVKVRLPWSPDPEGAAYEVWARFAVLMAGSNRGTWFIPDVNDEVLIAFEAGNPDRPYVLGGLWNGSDAPPELMDANNNLKTILSREGIRITMDDTSGAVKLRLETPGGHSIVLDDGQLSITAEDSNGNSIKMETQGITVTASAKVTVNASTVEVNAGMVTVNAGMSTFSGVVKCDTLITNLVVSASYTPGAGNVW